MRVQVPQFTDIETKLLGPLTLRQFVWLIIGGLVYAFAQVFLRGVWLIAAICAIAALFGSFAFIRVGNVSLPRYILFGIVYLFGQKKFMYTKPPETPESNGN